MGSSCTKCRGKTQDCCRVACGCCPCKSCKTVKVDEKFEKKEIPYGYAKIYAGVPMVDLKYTCPVLELHLWREAKTFVNINGKTNTKRVAFGGIQTERDNAYHHIGPLRVTEYHALERDEQVIVIPIESITSIDYSSDFKIEETKKKNVRIKTPSPPRVKVSCCTKLGQCCNKAFCGCCRHTKRQVHNEPEEITTTISNQQVKRNVLITLEYIRYNNIDTPSHLRVLPSDHRNDFYTNHFEKIPVQFYLLDNTDYEPIDFNFKRMQGSTLCRLIAQLKAMAGRYPDESTLNHIINRENNLLIGTPTEENFYRSTGTPRTVHRLQIPKSINDELNTRYENHDYIHV